MSPDEQQKVVDGLTTEFISRWEQNHRRRHLASNEPGGQSTLNEQNVQRVKELAIQLAGLRLPTVSSESSSAVAAASSADTPPAGPLPSVYEEDFLKQFLRANETARRYEDRDAAADVIPIARLFEEAEAKTADHPEDGLEDIVIR
ncbi:hypothetical protein DFQ26_006403 [Actinomortierella ambigua]|nr:hypothetical protein DFQ26_006403 [Actinomortierella ambigua]